ncbi:hypothetical protein [Roseibium sediminis]|uniref:hypothetical protein n=1 Tax=Roseibium sediminis TaxID=1775174 RepID=UPI001AD9284B|nr:hypothetical protein [Roseibium sediminis]
MMRGFKVGLLAAMVCMPTAGPSLAHPSGGARLPSCDAGSVQSAVARTMSRARKDYNDGLRITGLNRISQSRLDAGGTSVIARRYCRARADLSNGSVRTVYYVLEEDNGFVGIGWAVRACIPSADKWHVYGNACSTTRPR